MSIFISNIKKALDLKLIDQEQALYLVFIQDDITYPISATKLLELTRLKYIISNRIGKVLYTEDNVKLHLKGTLKANYTSELSAKIPAHICKLLCVKNVATQKIKFINDDDSINVTADKFLGGEGLVAYHFLIFLFLFPLRGETNDRWQKHFTGKPYKGARIRVRSKKTGKLFLRAIKNKDMGIFLYGTYLFIKSCIQEDRTFVKTIQNYMLEYEDWYLEAEEIVNKSTTIQQLFRNTVSNEGRINVVI